MARHPVALLTGAGDTDRARPLEQGDLTSHGSSGIGGRRHEHGLPGAQPRQMQQAEVGRHAGRAENPERRGGGRLSRVQQPRVMSVGHAQLLQSAIEYDDAPDTEDIVTRLDHFTDAARRNDIARPRQSMSRRVGCTAEGIDRQPQSTGEERAIGECGSVGFDQLEISRARGRTLDSHLQVAHRHRGPREIARLPSWSGHTERRRRDFPG